MNYKLYTLLTCGVVSQILGITTSTSAQSNQIITQNNDVKELDFKAPHFEGEKPALATVKYEQNNTDSSATLYIDNVPILTFVAGSKSSNNQIKQEVTLWDNKFIQYQTIENNQSPENPYFKARKIADQINQLNVGKIPNQKIEVSKKDDCNNCYSIKLNQQELIEINPTTLIPNTTGNTRQDAVKTANLLRKLTSKNSQKSILSYNNIVIPNTENSVEVVSVQTGIASWYGAGFHGGPTANGERYNQYSMTAAHKKLPFNTMVRVTNLNNGKSVIVRINNRGPYVRGRVIDLSLSAADALGMKDSGVAPVKLEILDRSQQSSIKK